MTRKTKPFLEKSVPLNISVKMPTFLKLQSKSWDAVEIFKLGIEAKRYQEENEKTWQEVIQQQARAIEGYIKALTE